MAYNKLEITDLDDGTFQMDFYVDSDDEVKYITSGQWAFLAIRNFIETGEIYGRIEQLAEDMNVKGVEINDRRDKSGDSQTDES